MWIECVCGAQIKDITDGVQNKAHLVTDPNWFEVSERQSEPQLSPWDWLSMARSVYECFECGRLWISDRGNKTFHTYAPEGDDGPGLLWR
jgi:hypothetical protein